MKDVLDMQISKTIKLLLLLLTALLLGLCYYYTVDVNVRTMTERADAVIDELTLRQQIASIKAENKSFMEKKLQLIKDTPNASFVADYDNQKNVMIFLNSVLAGADEYSIEFDAVNLPQSGVTVRRDLSVTFEAKDFSTAKAILFQLQNCPYTSLLNEMSLAPRASRSYSSAALREDLCLEEGPVSAGVCITFFESLKN